MTLKNIDAKIATFVTAAANVNALCHEIGMDILKWAAPTDKGGAGHGDCTRAQKLVMAMPASFRRSMLIAWFGKFSPILVKDSDKWDAKMHKAFLSDGKTVNPLYVEWDIEGADGTPFHVLAENTPEKSYDLETLLKMVASLSKQIAKKAADGKVPPADIDAANSLSIALAGIKITMPSEVSDPNRGDVKSEDKADMGDIATAMQQAAEAA